ncbi:potassium transporter TrkG [Thioclava sp. GXIMD4215]|uniref:potassium transporter TrkG n=1 Tax=Thioclava sp. GXIMD4215 TaxID=3131928 RepID=UPI00324457B9
MGANLRNLPLFVILVAVSGLLMYLPAIHALTLHQHAVARPFFYTGSLLLFVFVLLALATVANRRGPRERSSLLTMVGAFTLLPLVLAIPFHEVMRDTSLFNAWWEMVSALTTTGGTLYAPARLPPSLHLWRALVGWSGGYFMLVMTIAVLAPLRVGGFEIFFAGGPGGEVKDVNLRGTQRGVVTRDKMIGYALELLPVYTGLTGILWVLLRISGEDNLVALCAAMSTLATSGILPTSSLASGQSSVLTEVIIFVFFLPALSRRFWPGDGEMRATKRLRDDPELRLAAMIVLLTVILLFFRHWLAALDTDSHPGPGVILRTLWGGLFTTLSFLTTTGFESSGWEDARAWAGLGTPGLILSGLAIIGGGIATTAGGVRLLRVYALIRHGERELDLLVYPSSVGGGGSAARRLRRQGAFVAWIFFMLFALSISVVMIAISYTGLDFEPAMIFTVAALSNTGPLTAVAGDFPLAWGDLSTAAKAILAAAMVLGRLETLAIIALFNPELWRK